MASEIYQRMGPEQNQNGMQQTPQNPKDAALNLMRQLNIPFTKEQENDPSALMQIALRSGMFPQNRLSMAQNVLMQFMGRR